MASATGIPAPSRVRLPESAKAEGTRTLMLAVRSQGEKLDVETVPTSSRTCRTEHEN